MAAKSIYAVQTFVLTKKQLVAGRRLEFRSALEALGRAEREALRTAGVIVTQMTIDAETGVALDEPVVITRHGQSPTTGGLIQYAARGIATA